MWKPEFQQRMEKISQYSMDKRKKGQIQPSSRHHRHPHAHINLNKMQMYSNSNLNNCAMSKREDGGTQPPGSGRMISRTPNPGQRSGESERKIVDMKRDSRSAKPDPIIDHREYNMHKMVIRNRIHFQPEEISSFMEDDCLEEFSPAIEDLTRGIKIIGCSNTCKESNNLGSKKVLTEIHNSPLNLKTKPCDLGSKGVSRDYDQSNYVPTCIEVRKVDMDTVNMSNSMNMSNSEEYLELRNKLRGREIYKKREKAFGHPPRKAKPPTRSFLSDVSLSDYQTSNWDPLSTVGVEKGTQETKGVDQGIYVYKNTDQKIDKKDTNATGGPISINIPNDVIGTQYSPNKKRNWGVSYPDEKGWMRKYCEILNESETEAREAYDVKMASPVHNNPVSPGPGEKMKNMVIRNNNTRNLKAVTNYYVANGGKRLPYNSTANTPRRGGPQLSELPTNIDIKANKIDKNDKNDNPKTTKTQSHQRPPCIHKEEYIDLLLQPNLGSRKRSNKYLVNKKLFEEGESEGEVLYMDETPSTPKTHVPPLRVSGFMGQENVLDSVRNINGIMPIKDRIFTAGHISRVPHVGKLTSIKEYDIVSPEYTDPDDDSSRINSPGDIYKHSHTKGADSTTRTITTATTTSTYKNKQFNIHSNKIHVPNFSKYIVGYSALGCPHFHNKYPGKGDLSLSQEGKQENNESHSKTYSKRSSTNIMTESTPKIAIPVSLIKPAKPPNPLLLPISIQVEHLYKILAHPHLLFQILSCLPISDQLTLQQISYIFTTIPPIKGIADKQNTNIKIVYEKALMAALLNTKITSPLRARLWVIQTKIYSLRMHFGGDNGYYLQLLNRHCTQEDIIILDIQRTYTELGVFEEGGRRRKGLFNVLKALALHCSRIGYCQGINFLGALFYLFLRDEESTFWMMVHFMEKLNLDELYISGLVPLKVFCFQLDLLLRIHLPELYAYFNLHGIEGEYYAAQWFLTLFSYDLPLNIVCRALDLFIIEGWKAIFKLIISLLSQFEDEILELSYEDCLIFLKIFTREGRIDEKKLFAKYHTFDIKSSRLQYYGKLYADVQHKSKQDIIEDAYYHEVKTCRQLPAFSLNNSPRKLSTRPIPHPGHPIPRLNLKSPSSKTTKIRLTNKYTKKRHNSSSILNHKTNRTFTKEDNFDREKSLLSNLKSKVVKLFSPKKSKGHNGAKYNFGVDVGGKIF